MHLFSKYSYIWSFEPEKELAYNEFVKHANLISVRLVSFIAIFGMSLFLIIDLFKDIEYLVIFITRATSLVISSIIMFLTFRKTIAIRTIQLGGATIAITSLSVSLVTSTFTSLPGYYLTNLVFLIFVLVVTASGLNFRHGLVVNLICLTLFLIYSQFIRKDPFYSSQYPHIISIFIYIHIVGFVLEDRRRLSFLQFLDLSEQKKLVEDLNQQKDKVISVLSHDVAAPLSALSNILFLQAKGKLKEGELASFLNQVGEQLDDFKELLYGLVRWSKSQMEGFVSEKRQFDLGEQLKSTIRLFQPSAKQKNISLICEYQKSMILFSDEEMIKVAIRNLLSNAIKFAHENSEVSIQSYVNSFGRAEFKVTNVGKPFPSHLRDKVFTYEMRSTTGTSSEKGIGLGLAMTAFFVRFNDGEIYLDTTPNSDVVSFTIQLPLAAL